MEKTETSEDDEHFHDSQKSTRLCLCMRYGYLLITNNSVCNDLVMKRFIFLSYCVFVLVKDW